MSIKKFYLIRFSDPYVRVLMLNGKTGKKLKKRKTRTLHACAQPEFNETLTFDVTYDQLDTVQFLIVLCSKVRIIDYLETFSTNG